MNTCSKCYSHLGVQLSQSSLHGKKSKIVLDFVFHAVDAGFQVLDLRFLAAETWIPHTNCQWIPESLSCIPDSKVRISDFTSKDFPQAKSLGFRISLHGSIKLYSRLLHLSMNLKSKQLLTHNHSQKSWSCCYKYPADCLHTYNGAEYFHSKNKRVALVSGP